MVLTPVSVTPGTVPATQRSELGFIRTVGKYDVHEEWENEKSPPARVYYNRERLAPQCDIDIVKIVEVQTRCTISGACE